MASTQEVGQIFGEGSGPATAMLRSPTVLIASVGLWGMNVYFFKVFGIDFVHVLNLDLVKEREAQLLAASAVVTPSSPGDVEDVVDGGAGPKEQKLSSKSSELGDDDFLDDDLPEAPLPVNGEVQIELPSQLSATTQEVSVTAAGRHQRRQSVSRDTASPPIDPEVVASTDTEITASKLVFLSLLLLVLLHFTTYYWIDVHGGGIIGAVFFFYGAVTIGVVLPLPSTRWVRTAAVTVLQRAFELVNPRCSCVSQEPPRPIPFIDVFFADAMCSLSKVFFDWGMLFHLASHYPDPVPASTHSILIPSLFAAIPYIIRARQCLIMHTVGKLTHDPKRYLHLLNALKYSTSIFPLCLSAYQKTISPKNAEGLEGYLLMLLTINALYAFAWDVIMDWGMMQNPTAVLAPSCISSSSGESRAPTCGHAVLRPRLRFGVLMSTIILVADAVLRFSWLLRFYEKFLFPNKDSFVLCTQFLEVFRRAIWNLLRVEWENIKHTKSQAASSKGKSFDEEQDEIAPFLAPPKAIAMVPLQGHRA